MNVNFMDVAWQLLTQLLNGVKVLINLLFSTHDILGMQISPIAILGGAGLIALVIWSIVK